MNIKVEIERDASIRGYAIWITNELPDGTTQLAKHMELEFEPVEKDVAGVMWDKPTLVFSGRTADDFLRAFAQALAASGFKADELKNVNQEISAIKYHLEDMRKLVFHSNEPTSHQSQ